MSTESIRLHLLLELSRVLVEDSPSRFSRSLRLILTRGKSTRLILMTHHVDCFYVNRAGELTEAELDKISDILAKPTEYGIPKYFLNRQRCIKDGSWSQLISNGLDTRYREDMERLKKVRNHRGLRHFWGLKVKGQHTKSTGRTGKTLGVTKKK